MSLAPGQTVKAPAAVTRVQHPLPLADFQRDYLLRRTPVVIRAGDFADLDWRTARWTPEYLIDRVGDVPVLVHLRQQGIFGASGPGSHSQMPFADFVRRVMATDAGDDDLYLNLQNADLQITPPVVQLLGDFTVPVYFRHRTIRWINLWMGHSHSVTKSQLHHDYHDNLYCVVKGSKEFIVFPPRDARYLYPRGNILGIERNGRIHYSRDQLGIGPHFCAVETDKVDAARFPRFALASPQRVVLEEGDLLFLPTGWFHEVHSRGLHIALNFWAEPPESKAIEALP